MNKLLGLGKSGYLDWGIDGCHRGLFIVSFRWVHVDCERQEGTDPDTQVQDGYTCRVCKQVEEESRHNQPVSSQEASFTDPEPAEGEYTSLSTWCTSDGVVIHTVSSVVRFWRLDILLHTKTLFTPALMHYWSAETDCSLHLALACISNSSPVNTCDQILKRMS